MEYVRKKNSCEKVTFFSVRAGMPPLHNSQNLFPNVGHCSGVPLMCLIRFSIFGMIVDHGLVMFVV